MIAYPAIELRTPRLRLRPMRREDAPALFAIYSDPQVCRYLPFVAWKDIAQAQARIERDIAGMETNESLRLGFERIEDGLLLGDCCLFAFNTQCKRAEFGYSQLRSAWGNGYANEALSAVVRLAFEGIGLHRLEADIDPRNEGSARSLGRLGFMKEGHLRERWIVDGEVSDTGLYGLLRRDWERAAGNK